MEVYAHLSHYYGQLGEVPVSFGHNLWRPMDPPEIVRVSQMAKTPKKECSQVVEDKLSGAHRSVGHIERYDAVLVVVEKHLLTWPPALCYTPRATPVVKRSSYSPLEPVEVGSHPMYDSRPVGEELERC